ncbi:hypothetical protein GCM10010129_08580 [Streptomyces fumigatiscleroticus]|nr:hypothetical protein GCM10010129_08580 [Streptomyces fumigatiscleroticus]
MTGRRAAVLLLSVFLLLAGAGQAQATGYRYWSFWERDGGHWTYATEGPSTARPDDGDVQGFRFSVSEDSGDAARPRGTADFAAICADTPAREDRKRVALVLDFGTVTDAPPGETPPGARTECAVLPEDATAAQALAAVAEPLRYSSSALLCAIAGYPRTGCGGTVKDHTVVRSAEPESTDDGGPSAGLVAGVAVVAVLAAAAAWQARRRRP